MIKGFTASTADWEPNIPSNFIALQLLIKQGTGSFGSEFWPAVAGFLAEEVFVLEAAVLEVFEVLLETLFDAFLLVELGGELQSADQFSVFGVLRVGGGRLVARQDVLGGVEFRDDSQRLNQRSKQLLVRNRSEDLVMFCLQRFFYFFGFLFLLLLGRCTLVKAKHTIIETIVRAFVDL